MSGQIDDALRSIVQDLATKVGAAARTVCAWEGLQVEVRATRTPHGVDFVLNFVGAKKDVDRLAKYLDEQFTPYTGVGGASDEDGSVIDFALRTP